MALERAKETIYIEDWWLSPELFMRRPPYFNQEWRLDQILKRRAEAGVKIYVVVYREVEVSDRFVCEMARRLIFTSNRLLSLAILPTRNMRFKLFVRRAPRAMKISRS